MKNVKTFAFVCAAAMTASALIMSSCSKGNDDLKPVPEITIKTQSTAPDALVEGSIPADTKLTVEASVTEGATLKYQWYSNTASSNKDGTVISGATSASYTIPTTLTTGTYYYFCEVSAEKAQSKRTAPVTVTVSAPLTYSITLSEQKNSVSVGNVGEVDYDLSMTGITIDNEDLFMMELEIKWYATAKDEMPMNDLPEGVMGYKYQNGVFSVGLAPTTVSGDYYFTITYKDVTSNRAKLTISQ